MMAAAMAPYGAGLLAYHRGNGEATLVMRRDDGLEVPLPVSHFFRGPAEFSAIEEAALELCRGRVLDVGGGTGSIALELQGRGIAVRSIDLCAEAVEVMRARGVRDVARADVWDLADGGWDTVLLLGHGLGLVEDLAGLDRFLVHARRLLAPGGQLLADSLDVRRTDDPRHLAYHERLRAEGRDPGEVRTCFEFEGVVGPFCGWLQADAATLEERARRAGWSFELVRDEPWGDYLARLGV